MENLYELIEHLWVVNFPWFVDFEETIEEVFIVGVRFSNEILCVELNLVSCRLNVLSEIQEQVDNDIKESLSVFLNLLQSRLSIYSGVTLAQVQFILKRFQDFSG